MNLTIKVNGGYADQHKISLDDISVLAKSIQTISKNYEYKINKESYTDIYISAEKAGSYEIILDLLNNPIVNNPITQGLASTYLYELLQEIKNFVAYGEKKTAIQKLVSEIYDLAFELAEADSYDYKFEEKNLLFEKKQKILEWEYSSFNAAHEISKIVKQTSDEQSNKPDNISFIASDLQGKLQEIQFNSQIRRNLHDMAHTTLDVNDITVSGLPINLSRSPSTYFKMKAPFFGTLKIHVTQEELEKISEYFRKNIPITVKLKPILKVGDMIKTKEGILTAILEEGDS